MRDYATSKMLMPYELVLECFCSLHVDCVVSGATVPELIMLSSKKVRGRSEICSPGVGTQGGDPKRTLDAGSDYIIAGRTILDSNNPVSKARKLQRLTLQS